MHINDFRNEELIPVHNTLVGQYGILNETQQADYQPATYTANEANS